MCAGPVKQLRHTRIGRSRRRDWWASQSQRFRSTESSAGQRSIGSLSRLGESVWQPRRMNADAALDLVVAAGVLLEVRTRHRFLVHDAQHLLAVADGDRNGVVVERVVDEDRLSLGPS